jgi:hypothetical protein
MESTTYEFSGLSVLHTLCIIGKPRKFHALRSFGRPKAFVLSNSALILYTTRMVALVAAIHQFVKWIALEDPRPSAGLVAARLNLSRN